MACATDTVDDQTYSRGYKHSREKEERLLGLLSRLKWILEAARWSPS
jgi:hypothetical protein